MSIPELAALATEGAAKGISVSSALRVKAGLPPLTSGRPPNSVLQDRAARLALISKVVQMKHTVTLMDLVELRRLEAIPGVLPRGSLMVDEVFRAQFGPDFERVLTAREESATLKPSAHARIRKSPPSTSLTGRR